MANSGLYARRQEIVSVLHAIAMVGLQPADTDRGHRSALARHPQPDLPLHESLVAPLPGDGAHRRANGRAAHRPRVHGRPAPRGRTTGAVFEHAAQENVRLVGNSVTDGLDLMGNERAVYGTDHAELAGHILEAWGLPEVLQDAAALHHWPNVGGKLADAVQLGCVVAEHIGFWQACGYLPKRAAGEFSRPWPKIIKNKSMLDVFMTEVNSIECSLA